MNNCCNYNYCNNYNNHYYYYLNSNNGYDNSFCFFFICDNWYCYRNYFDCFGYCFVLGWNC